MHTVALRNIAEFRFNARTGTLFILFFTIIMEALISVFHFPGTIRYLNDVVLLSVVPSLFHYYVPLLKRQHATLVLYAVLSLFSFDILTAVINMVEPQLVLWAIRNTFRGIIYCFSVLVVLRVEDVEKLFNYLFWLQIPNLLLGTYQWLFIDQGLGDQVHGLFANGAGANMFSVVLVSYYLNAYLAKRKSLFRVGITMISAIFMAVIGEEKTCFVYLIAILVISLLVSKWSLRTIFFSCLIAVVCSTMINWIQAVRPSMLNIFFDSQETSNYLTSSWDNAYGIPRVGAFHYISSRFFDNDLLREMIGLGFGNCEDSQFSFLQSDFADSYRNLSYRVFTHQWTFLETGYIGFILLVFFFISIIICLISNRIHKRTISDSVLNITSICIAGCCIISMWSNSTIKLDSSFIPYFGISLGFLLYRRNLNGVSND